jgi:surface polysaccharide O-acyltransferase-like enzyme
MQNRSGWLQGVQYFRAIAIIEVIAFHATLVVTRADITALTPQKDVIIAFAAFTAFAVPHFVFISGVVLYNKYNEGFSVSTFYKRRFSSVLPPYLIWTTFYFCYPYLGAALYTAVFHLPTARFGSIPDTSQLLSGYLTALFTGVKQLWFVVLILQLYLLYPLLVRFYNRFARQKNPIYVLSVLLFAQIAYTSYFYVITGVQSYYNNLFLSVIFYFIFGFFVSEHYETIKQKIRRFSIKSISLAVVLSTVFYSIVFYHVALISDPAPSDFWLYQIAGPFYCLLLIAFYLRFSMKWETAPGFFTDYIEKIGEDSFGIYLTHLFFETAFTFVLPELGLSWYNLLFYPVLFLLTLISSYLSVQVLYRLPFSAIVTGKPRNKLRGAA